MNAQKILRIAHGLMPASIALMVAGVYVGFIDHQAWSLQAQVGAHIGIMLGAALLKLSYVMYLNASKHLRINDFAPAHHRASGAQSRLGEFARPEYLGA